MTFRITLANVNHLAPGRRRAEIVSAYDIAMYRGIDVALVATAVLADASSLRSATALVTAAIGAGVIGSRCLRAHRRCTPRTRFVIDNPNNGRGATMSNRLDGAKSQSSAEGLAEWVRPKRRCSWQKALRWVIADILNEAGEALATSLGNAAIYVHCDVGEESDWSAVVKTAVGAFGTINILINNAGVFRRAPIPETSVELLELHYRVNQLGPFLGMREVFPVMKEAGGGSIVNVSSISGMRALPGHAAYGSTKWAVRGMTKYAATEFGRHGIRVNSTHPGFIDTVMLEENLDEVNDAIPDVTPLGRRGTVEELAEVTLYLASDASSYINGAEVTIDGGTSI